MFSRGVDLSTHSTVSLVSRQGFEQHPSTSSHVDLLGCCRLKPGWSSPSAHLDSCTYNTRQNGFCRRFTADAGASVSTDSLHRLWWKLGGCSGPWVPLRLLHSLGFFFPDIWQKRITAHSMKSDIIWFQSQHRWLQNLSFLQ